MWNILWISMMLVSGSVMANSWDEFMALEARNVAETQRSYDMHRVEEQIREQNELIKQHNEAQERAYYNQQHSFNP